MKQAVPLKLIDFLNRKNITTGILIFIPNSLCISTASHLLLNRNEHALGYSLATIALFMQLCLFIGFAAYKNKYTTLRNNFAEQVNEHQTNQREVHPG